MDWELSPMLLRRASARLLSRLSSVTNWAFCASALAVAASRGVSLNSVVFRNSARNSPIDGYRSVGFFLSIRSRMASASGVTFGLKKDGAGAGSETCRTRRSWGLSP